MLSFWRSRPSRWAEHIGIVEMCKYLVVHLNNKLDWTQNTDALCKRGQSCLHLLRRSFSMSRTLLKTVYDSMVVSAILAVIYWGCGISTGRDWARKLAQSWSLGQSSGFQSGGEWEDDINQADIKYGQSLLPATGVFVGAKHLFQWLSPSCKTVTTGHSY